MNTLTILTFGQIADITGAPEISIPEVADTDQLRNYLAGRYPALTELSFLVTVDKQIVRQVMPLSTHSEIALLPPFSGG